MYQGYETDLFQLMTVKIENRGRYVANFQMKEKQETITAYFDLDVDNDELWSISFKSCTLFTYHELRNFLDPLLSKIEDEIILKNEKETPTPVIYDVSFSSADILKKDFVYTSFFHIKNDKRKFALSFLYSSDTDAWRYFVLEEETEEKDNYRTLRPYITLTYPDFVFDQVMDEFISLLKENPSTRIQATLLDNNRKYDCSLYEEIKEYKKKNA